jgi:hypothetical protein
MKVEHSAGALRPRGGTAVIQAAYRLALGVLAIATCLASIRATAATWEWPCPELAAATVKVEIAPVKYGKTWAYAIEFDDGGSFVRTHAEALITGHQFTDAPPGVADGTPKPFVAGLSLFAAPLDGGNTAYLTWAEIRRLHDRGWGVVNHSYWHSGNHWDPKEFLTEDQFRRELFWSQAVFGHFIWDGKQTCCHFVFPSGDSHYGPHLAEFGLLTRPVATRQGNSLTAPAMPFDAASKWRRCRRNNLDHAAWVKSGGEPMAAFPQPAPAPGELVVDFTHGIAAPGTDNYRNWETRLSTIEQRYGIKGDDSLWCAPTAEILAYHELAKTARAEMAKGTLTVTFPEKIPPSSLTLILTCDPAMSGSIVPPPGGLVFRHGTTLWLTTPPLGKPWPLPPSPRVAPVHRLPFAPDITLPAPVSLAAVRILQRGGPATSFVPKITLIDEHGAEHDLDLAPLLRWCPVKSRWGNWLLFPVVPDHPAPLVKGLRMAADPCFKEVEIWAVDVSPDP